MADRRLSIEHLVTPTEVIESATMIISDGRIGRIATADHHLPAHEVSEVITGWAVPGFVDTHCHGGGGFTFGSTIENALGVRDFHRRHGTTSMFASLVTDEIEALTESVRLLSGLVAAQELAGIHLEGPFLSRAKRGAHDTDLLIHPDPELIKRLLDAGRGAVSMITIAPELPGALEAIRQLTRRGVIVAVGHTDADHPMIMKALDHGAQVATHLFNAMRPIHHRAPGPVPALLTDPRVVVELIPDGVHLDDSVLAMAVAAAGPERVAIITDAIVAAGMSDGRYALGGLSVDVAHGRARIVEDDGSLGSIAGSTLTMAEAFTRLIGLGLGPQHAAQLTATTPARVHGLDSVGALTPGRRADLCVVDDHGRLLRVMVGGDWIESSPAS